MPLNKPVPSDDPAVLRRNASDIDRVVNGEAQEVETRTGKSIRTLAGINAQFDAMQAGELTMQAVEAADRAETAAEQAYAAGRIYESSAAGQADANLADGDYFFVVSADSDEVLELWRKGASSPTDTGKRSPSFGYQIVNFNSIEFEQGGISNETGELVNSEIRIRTPLYSALFFSASVDSTKRLSVYLYDPDGNYIGRSSYVQNFPLTKINGSFRVAVRNNPDDTTPILPSESNLTATINHWSKETAEQQAQIDNKADKNNDGKLDQFLLTKSVFESGSSIESWEFYDPKQFISLQIWDREESDSFYLNTLYRYFFVSVANAYQASLGFKRVSDNKHVCAAPAPIIGGTNPAQYARWEVTEPPSGVQEYYLYLEGDTNNPPMGVVKINWDLVPSNQAIRYIGTDGLTPVITENLGLTVQKTKFVRSNEINTNPFLGKKIVGLGDSITYGFIPRNDPDYPGQLNSWLVLVAGQLGMSYVNYGISGSTLGDLNNGTRSPFTGRYQSMDDDADVVVVMGGTNDVRNGVPLGTMADRTPYTYYGALHVLCEGLIDKYQVQQGLTIGKEKIILFMTPIKLLNPSAGDLDAAIEPYAEAVKEVCAYYSLPVFDSYNLSGITPHILQTVVGTEPGYTGNYNPYITDGTHPTQEGHEMWAKKIAGFIKSLD